MQENQNFTELLEKALTQKQEWFNLNRLPHLLDLYRLHYTCVKNLNEVLTKKSIIIADPYKLDRRISEIVVPETSSFPETEAPSILGERFSEYETMLDFICTYLRFSIENFTIQKIKLLLDLNHVFDWQNITANSTKSNTRSLAMSVNQARSNATAVLVSTINDSLDKCTSSTLEIENILNELADFQKELYKGRLRKDLFEHPEFDRQKAFSSPEDEMAEIKKLFPKVIGKKPFYNDLVSEIINEDQAPNNEALKAKILAKLQIKQEVENKKKESPNTKNILLEGIVGLAGFSPVLSQIYLKLEEDFGLLFFVKKTFFEKLKEVIRKAFGIKEKEKICTVPITDEKTGAKSLYKISVTEFLNDIDKKRRIYATFANNGSEFQKISNAAEEQILLFLTKQLTENQKLFILINSLDDYFKTSVDILLRPKLKGLKIDLSSYRNIIINVNKKRGEYVSLKEEEEQMKKLGIKNE